MGSPVHSFIVSTEKKIFLPFLSSFPFPSEHPCFSSCLSSSFRFWLCRAGSTFSVSSCRHLQWLFSPPEATPAPGQTTPAPSASLHRASAPVLHHHGGPQVNSFVVMSLCLGLRTKNLFLSFLQHFHRIIQIIRK